MNEPREQLRELIRGCRISQAIYVVSELGIPDLLADGPREVDELARAFWLMVPHAAAGAALTWRILPTAAAPAGRAPQVPLGRLGLLCAGVLCVASVANVGSTAGRVTLLAAAIAAIALMLRQDGAARDRLFPAQMLSLRQRVGQGFWMIFFVAMSTTPGSVYLRVTAAWGGVGCCRRARGVAQGLGGGSVAADKGRSTYPVDSAWADMLRLPCRERRPLPRPDFADTLAEFQVRFPCAVPRSCGHPGR